MGFRVYRVFWLQVSVSGRGMCSSLGVPRREQGGNEHMGATLLPRPRRIRCTTATPYSLHATATIRIFVTGGVGVVVVLVDWSRGRSFCFSTVKAFRQAYGGLKTADEANCGGFQLSGHRLLRHRKGILVFKIWHVRLSLSVLFSSVLL